MVLLEGFAVRLTDCFLYNVFLMVSCVHFAVRLLHGNMSARKKTPFQKHREEEEAKKKAFFIARFVFKALRFCLENTRTVTSAIDS